MKSQIKQLAENYKIENIQIVQEQKCTGKPDNDTPLFLSKEFVTTRNYGKRTLFKLKLSLFFTIINDILFTVI